MPKFYKIFLLIPVLATCLFFVGTRSALADQCGDKYPTGSGSGACMDVADCTPAKADPPGTAVQAIPGLCPGAANIQCCVFTADIGKGGGSGGGGGTTLPDPLGTSDIRVVIGRIINYALGFVGAVALMMFIYGGFLWMLSGGESARVKKGRDTLVWATIGLAVIFASYALVNFVIGGLTAGTK